MGSFSELLIGEYPILSLKNTYDIHACSLIFTKEDYIVQKRPNSSRSHLVWGQDVCSQKGTYKFKGFSQTAKICRERLEIFGVNLKSAKKDFNEAKRLAQKNNFYNFSLRNVTYENYLEEIKDILIKNEINYESYSMSLRETLTSDGLYIYGQSTSFFLYSILSCLEDDIMIEYDLTQILIGGWIKEDLESDLDIYKTYEKTIILTEGKTDSEFIKMSLSKLYPHLAHRYHFLDFNEYKVEGSASALAKLIVSFIASGIKHPIIALFDNDTTGIKEMSNIGKYTLPENIKVFKYPEISLAKNYPTIGPSGKKKMNVNSLACSIEMYLGDDVLIKDGSLLPVYWKSFDDKLQKYQGEILEKNDIQKSFREKIKNDEIKDFRNMDLILKMIFQAFQI